MSQTSKITTISELVPFISEVTGALFTTEPPSPQQLLNCCYPAHRRLIGDTICAEGLEASLWMIRESVRRRVKIRPPVLACCSHTSDTALLEMLAENVQHFVHVSADPGFVAYTPSAAYGIQDRCVRTTIGRYAKKFHPELTDSQVRSFSDTYRYYHNANSIQWAVSEEDIIATFEEGPNSCMSHRLENKQDARWGSHVHPSAAYLSPDIKVAYLIRGGRITARCVCVEMEKTKLYIRVYGDELLKAKLHASGYTQGSLLGARLAKIPALTKAGVPLPDTFVMPYLDDQLEGDNHSVQDNGEYFICVHNTTSVEDRSRPILIARSCSGLIGLGGNKNYTRSKTKFTIQPALSVPSTPVQTPEICCMHCAHPIHDIHRSENYSERYEQYICPSCMHLYVRAIYNDSLHTTLVRKLSTLRIGSEYILNDESVLVSAGCVQVDESLYPTSRSARWANPRDVRTTSAGKCARTVDTVQDTVFNALWHFSEVLKAEDCILPISTDVWVAKIYVFEGHLSEFRSGSTPIVDVFLMSKTSQDFAEHLHSEGAVFATKLYEILSSYKDLTGTRPRRKLQKCLSKENP